MKKYKKAGAFLSVLLLIIVFLNPYIDLYKYKKSYEDNPNANSLFELCNISAYCYTSDFYTYSKMFFDNYDVKEIQNIYQDESNELVYQTYDTFLAEFLVKSIIQNYITQEEFNKYLFKFKDDAFFVRVFVEYVDKYCLSNRKIKLVIDFFNDSLAVTTNYTQEMVIYTIQIYLYEYLDDEKNLKDTMNKQNSIKDFYYEEKSSNQD